MGFWGWLGGKVKSACRKVASGLKEAKDWIKEKATNVWNKFTGKKDFEEAEKLYEKISEKYNHRRKNFETDVENYTKSIERYVDAINKYKVRIKKELLPQMAEKLKRLIDSKVSKEFSFEEFEIKGLTFDELRAKEKLYKIDFKKHPIKSNALAVLTLGFYTRKKAKETLYAVQEEEKKIDCEIAKMDAETKRLEAIDASLSNVSRYFEGLIELYENMLTRADNAVNFLFVRCMRLEQKIVKEQMTMKHLSKIQQTEIKVLYSASLILKTMADMTIVSVEEKKHVIEFEDKVHHQYDEMIRSYNAA